MGRKAKVNRRGDRNGLHYEYRIYDGNGTNAQDECLVALENGWIAFNMY